jgi:hypothetical protein
VECKVCGGTGILSDTQIDSYNLRKLENIAEYLSDRPQIEVYDPPELEIIAKKLTNLSKPHRNFGVYVRFNTKD